MTKARQETGIPIAVEVANAKHAEAALRAQVDVLWIGARTTVNPFAVQEIAEAIRGVDIPVMVKNPVNPELMLWLGAIERLQEAGCQDIAAILRGFSCLSTGRWRNEPLWQIAIDLRQHLPGIPLFCDPSHIAGRSDGVAEIAQEALNLDFDGLMIEAHCCPEQAVSDAAQQLRPEDLGAILAKLVVRQRTSDPGSACQQRLLELRTEIDSRRSLGDDDGSAHGCQPRYRDLTRQQPDRPATFALGASTQPRPRDRTPRPERQAD